MGLRVLEKLVSGLKVTTAVPLLISMQVKGWSGRENLPGVDVISTGPVSLLPVEFFFFNVDPLICTDFFFFLDIAH